jgi:hypothetical protein
MHTPGARGRVIVLVSGGLAAGRATRAYTGSRLVINSTRARYMPQCTNHIAARKRPSVSPEVFDTCDGATTQPSAILPGGIHGGGDLP